MPPRILFLGSTYAGHATRLADLKSMLSASEHIRPLFREVTGWSEGGRLERLPFVPRAVKGRLRAVREASAFISVRPAEVVWTSCREELLPFVTVARGPLRRPVVLDLDATDGQLEAWAPEYFGRPPRTGIRARLADLHERAIFRGVTHFTPWSRWAAAGLERQGVDPGAVTVIPPGIDLERWRPGPARADAGPLRVLFVGGDFQRKGGDFVIAAARAPGLDVQVDIVTRETVPDLPPNARTWRLERDSPQLGALFGSADILVLPSRAECFGIVALEAMASGLPVVMSRRGAADEIVESGLTGELIEPTVEDLVAALRALAADRDRVRRMGVAARRRAEEEFGLNRTTGRLRDLLLQVAESGRGGRDTQTRHGLHARTPG